MKRSIKLLYSLIVIGLIGWLLTIALSRGFSNHWLAVSRTSQELKGVALVEAVGWNSTNPEVMKDFAYGYLGVKREGSAKTAIQLSLMENPSQPDLASELAMLNYAHGELQASRQGMRLSEKIGPVDASMQYKAANYWYQLGELREAVQGWNKALMQDFRFRRRLFPLIRGVIEEPRTEHLISELMQQDLDQNKRFETWWNKFVDYMATEDAPVASYEAIVRVRQEGLGRLPQQERSLLIRKYMASGMMDKARESWERTLTREERKSTGRIYDGSFEGFPESPGFGWQFGLNAADVSVRQVFGTQGSKALTIRFRGKQVTRWNLRQILHLEPGRYRLSARTRLGNLKATSGLRWAVRCHGEEGEQLGRSERLLGSSNWKNFQFEFEVPDEGCAFQVLWLRPNEFTEQGMVFRGDAWFDAFRISRDIEGLGKPRKSKQSGETFRSESVRSGS